MLHPRSFAILLCLAAAATAGFSQESTQAGYNVTVRYKVTSAGEILDPAVVATDGKLLNPYALMMVARAKLDPAVLPASGEKPKLVETPLHFPVEDYAGNVPWPEAASQPQAVKRVPPFYPYECRTKGISGGALLALTINAEGKVEACKVIASSHPGFATEAARALQKWKFKPAGREGQAIACTINIAVPFQLVGQLSGWQWVIAPAPALPTFLVETMP